MEIRSFNTIVMNTPMGPRHLTLGLGNDNKMYVWEPEAKDWVLYAIDKKVLKPSVKRTKPKRKR